MVYISVFIPTTRLALGVAEQVTSFARDAKELITKFSKEGEVQLGAFLVPWRKSEHG